jgi:glutaredoxin 3
MGEDMAADVVLYTTDYCGYCYRAVHFLKDRGVQFTQVDVTGDAPRRKWLISATGRRTVPQCFINGRSVGGYTDLVDLERSGKLDSLLAEDPAPDRPGSASPAM